MGALIDPVSCVSCVSWMRWVYAAETHKTFRQESGMRYHHSSQVPIRSQAWIGLRFIRLARRAFARSRP